MVNNRTIEFLKAIGRGFRWLFFLQVLFFIFALPLFSQQYPRWFLFQNEVKCSPHAVAIVTSSSFYRDSAIANGFTAGCDLLARYSFLKISGGQAFWATEAGTFAIGSNYKEEYDQALAGVFHSRLRVLDSYSDKQKTIVLIGDSSCTISDSTHSMVRVEYIVQPSWVERLPSEKDFAYGVGLSQEYFYEQSSWQTAEKNSYMSLARTMGISLQALQKQDAIEHQDVRNEDMNVVLQGVEIVARWKDTKRKIFYVLSRVKK